jgi:uncharacterized membrane protein
MFSLIIFGAMLVLAVWALSNLGYAIYKRNLPETPNKYFWQMNGLWNIVNLLIASVAIVYVIANRYTLNSNLNSQHTQIKIVAINILLDIIYVIMGLWLENHGKLKSSNRLQGYGNAIQLQGAFLFFFDTALTTALIIATI